MALLGAMVKLKVQFPSHTNVDLSLDINVNGPEYVDVVILQGQLEFQHFEDEREHKNVSDKREEKQSNWVSMGGAADTVKDDNMTQAIKKVLAENFPIKEESESQILLYKNLWLEAEASLCSVNYITRFNRMKIEMEKGNSQKANGKPIAYSDRHFNLSNQKARVYVFSS
ncbi:unnamed protein product [Dovyalis caffra]|uniref:Uncharacterized protein n=1 Tax=Dovyalis caffra TaxID=77055 RepID=A0AAV1QU42_9ROSI|nr:unnamed protein product [Dovyalis caffra]